MPSAALYVKAVTERQLVEAESMRSSLSFEKDNIRLSNTAYHNCYNLAPERAETDKLLNNFYSVIDKCNNLIKKWGKI